MCRVGVGQYHIQFVQYKTIMPMESPVNHKNQHVCVCVCIYVYVCLYVFIYLQVCEPATSQPIVFCINQLH